MKILITENQMENLVSYEELYDIIYDFYYDGSLNFNPNTFVKETHKRVFNDLVGIVEELRDLGVKSDDFMNYHNLGFNSKGTLCYFDIGYGDYYEEFEDQPHEVDVNELDLKIDDSTIGKLMRKFNGSEYTKLGDGGNFGMAYDLHDGRVLKITKDKTEAVNSKKIQGKDTKHLAKIYDVRFLNLHETIFYVIVLEKLNTDISIPKILMEINDVIVKNQTNNFKPEIIQVIGKKNPIVAEFLNYMYEFGYDKTWEKYISFVDEYPQYDFNDISEISEWIVGSKTNNNKHSDEVPEHIIQLVTSLIK